MKLLFSRTELDYFIEKFYIFIYQGTNSKASELNKRFLCEFIDYSNVICTFFVLNLDLEASRDLLSDTKRAFSHSRVLKGALQGLFWGFLILLDVAQTI